MSYADDIARARRLAALFALYFAPAYTLPLPALRAQVERTGYVASLDLLGTECAWLVEQGLVEALGEDVWRLTDRGVDVTLGRSINPGVQRPRPGELDP